MCQYIFFYKFFPYSLCVMSMKADISIIPLSVTNRSLITDILSTHGKWQKSVMILPVQNRKRKTTVRRAAKRNVLWNSQHSKNKRWFVTKETVSWWMRAATMAFKIQRWQVTLCSIWLITTGYCATWELSSIMGTCIRKFWFTTRHVTMSWWKIFLIH